MAEDDYLVIELPVEATAAWDESKTPTCEMKNGGHAKKCEILDKRACRITLGAQRHLVIRGSISNFINPVSIAGISPITATLYESARNRNEVDVAAVTSALSLS